MSSGPTRKTNKVILHSIGGVLRERIEDLVEEPIPTRWVQLIKDLNEKERDISCVAQSRCANAGPAKARLPRREAKNEQTNATTRS